MSSSTSNSREAYKPIALRLGLAMAAALAALNLFYFAMGIRAENIIDRVVESRQALPKIVSEEKDLMLFFGSSMVEAGFSPRVYDRKMLELGKNVKSFNFGFGGLNPYYQDFLSRRIKEAFQENDRRIKLSVIEFNPFQTTKKRWEGAQFTIDSYLTMLASNSELWEVAKTDFERGALLFTIKYLRNDISAEIFTSFIGRQLFPGQRPPRQSEPEEIRKKRRELRQKLMKKFEEEYPDYEDADWYYPWQGGGTIASERSEETLQIFRDYYATFQNPIHKENARQRRIARADIEGLNFEPVLLNSFVQIVKNFQAVSEHVEVVILPRQTEVIKYNEETKARLAKAIKQIEEKTGVTIRNQQELPQFTPDMYSDATHFTRYHGDMAYTQLIVEEFKEHFDEILP